MFRALFCCFPIDGPRESGRKALAVGGGISHKRKRRFSTSPPRGLSYTQDMNNDPSNTASRQGLLYGLGLGPGDPELMTLKAHRLLQQVEVIAYPSAEGTPSLVRAIAAPYLPKGVIEIDMAMPMVEARFPAQQVYDAAADQISQHLNEGRSVAVLCEGDPLFYGSFMYLYQRLEGQAPVQIVPGVTSLSACAAAAGLPLVARKDILTVLPGPLSDEALTRRLTQGKSLDQSQDQAFAIMKVGRHFARLKALLGRLGLADQAWYIERATTSEQRVERLADVDQANAPYFSMILLHKRGRADAL